MIEGHSGHFFCKYCIKAAGYKKLAPILRIQINKRHGMSHYVIHWGLRFVMSCYMLIIWLTKIIGPRCKCPEATTDRDFDILLTGTFYSNNWITSHISPLVTAKRVANVYLVTVFPVPEMDKLEVIIPPGWLIKIIGAVPARLFTFILAGIRIKPDIVGGFHLLLNGLAALPLAQLVGAHSLYICCGGPREVLGGGYTTENRIFNKLKTADIIIERQLLKVVGNFDLVVTRGNRAIDFFSEKGVDASFYVVPGGIDAKKFYPSAIPPSLDLIITGRISSVKRIDIFLEIVRQVRQEIPNVQAIIVGDGPLRVSMEQLSQQLGITENIRFAGHQDHVEDWLRMAKLFVLTSDSEGLSLSMIEAMLCGLPAIVSDVGDLGELVENGKNGYLIDNRSPGAFAEKIVELLSNADRLAQFSKSAHSSALRCEASNVSRIWDETLVISSKKQPVTRQKQ